jgi:phage gpG-like protein
MSTVSINAEELPAAMAAHEQRLAEANLSSFFGQVARPVVLQGERDLFTSSVSPDGQSWPPRVVVGDGHPILIDEGRLLQAATGGGPGHISRVASQEMILGVEGDVSGAIFHAEGTSRMPARPFMGATEETEELIEARLADHLLAEVFE